MAQRGVFAGPGRTRSPDNAAETTAPAEGTEGGVTTGPTVNLTGVPGQGSEAPPPAEPAAPPA